MPKMIKESTVLTMTTKESVTFVNNLIKSHSISKLGRIVNNGNDKVFIEMHA